MKRFTSIEVGGMALAAFFILGGLACVIWPQAGVIVHFTNTEIGWPGASAESISISGARVYGFVGIALGSAIAVLAIYRGKD